MKKTLIIGNWKMHMNVHEASLLVKRLGDKVHVHRDIEVVLAPTALNLQPLSVQIDKRKFSLSAQNAFYMDEGAFTGEISFTQLRGLAEFCIIGHSERRIYFNEELETIRDKVAAAIRNEVRPVLCIGETHEEKVAGETKTVIHDQLTTALANITAADINKVVVAYEPVWAISTFNGEIAKPDDIKPIITLIRRNVAELYGEQASKDVTVLYGGSVDDTTAGAYLSIEGVEGLLVGGASLNYHKFSGIIDVAYRQLHQSPES